MDPVARNPFKGRRIMFYWCSGVEEMLLVGLYRAKYMLHYQ
jgi:hypothetical protein